MQNVLWFLRRRKHFGTKRSHPFITRTKLSCNNFFWVVFGGVYLKNAGWSQPLWILACSLQGTRLSTWLELLACKVGWMDSTSIKAGVKTWPHRRGWGLGRPSTLAAEWPNLLPIFWPAARRGANNSKPEISQPKCILEGKIAEKNWCQVQEKEVCFFQSPVPPQSKRAWVLQPVAPPPLIPEPLLTSTRLDWVGGGAYGELLSGGDIFFHELQTPSFHQTLGDPRNSSHPPIQRQAHAGHPQKIIWLKMRFPKLRCSNMTLFWYFVFHWNTGTQSAWPPTGKKQIKVKKINSTLYSPAWAHTHLEGGAS